MVEKMNLPVFSPPCYFCKESILTEKVCNIDGPNFNEFPRGQQAHKKCYVKMVCKLDKNRHKEEIINNLICNIL